jgi:ribonuclease P/MRP protein subunit POP5
MKINPPTMREKKRYVVFRIHSEGSILYHNMKSAVFDSLLDFLGEKEMAKANVRIIKNLWNGREKKGFVQTNPKYVDSVKTALSLIHQIGDERVIFQTLRVSGTIKSGKGKKRGKK